MYAKILIIRFSSIGDIVLTTPVIRCVKKQWNAEIHFLTKPSFASLLKDNPHIDKIHSLDDDQAQSVSKLKLESFDFVIDLHKNWRSRRIVFGLNIPSVSYDKLNIKKWLSTQFKLDVLPQKKHLIDRYFEALSPYNLQNDGEGLDFFISIEDKEDAYSKVKDFETFQVLVLGATYFTKRIPKEKCLEIIHKNPFPTILLGGKDVLDLSSELVNESEGKAISFCGKVSLSVSAAIISYSNLVWTADTGLMHISAALQKPIHILWGNTIPVFGMYPYYGSNHPDQSIDYQVNLSCRPCSKLGYDKCPKGHFKCMMNQKI